MNKPIVGITMGDPAGSGPEITIKALADPEQYSYCRPIVVGDVKVMEQAKKFVGREDIVIHRCEKVSDALFTPGTIDVLHLDLIEDISKFEMAKVSVEGGNAAFQCVKKVIELAMAGEVDATCTNALNKEAMNKALEYYHGEKSDGYTHFDGHTVGFVYDREKQEWKAVEGVNVTLGLPIIRASVDHGTDFYHAGKGNGNELSLVNAIKYAVKMTGRAH